MPSNTVKFTPEKPAKEKRSHGLGITIFSAVVLVIIVVTFIGAPVVSKASEQASLTFGSYDGINIDYLQGNTFAQQVEQISAFYQQFSQSQDTEQQRMQVWRQAFDQTALTIAMKREAERAGIVVTQGRIDKTLVNHSAYLKDGKFSQELYLATTAADRYRYSQDAKTDLLVQQYMTDRTQSTLLSSGTKTFVASMAYPQKKFSFVTFTDADYPAQLVADYAAKNKDLFRTIDLSRITITSSEGDANKVREEAVKGEKAFADLAKSYSKDSLKDAGGTLSVRHYYEMKSLITKPEDLDKVFALPKGAISAVIKSDSSWVIFKVNVPSTEADLTSADTQAIVRSYVARNDRGLLEDNLEAQAKAFGEEAKTDFAAAAKKLGKTVATSSWVSLNFGNFDLFPAIYSASSDTVFQGLASSPDFFQKAFKLEKGAVSAPVLASPAVLVFKVDDVKTEAAKEDTPVTADSVDNSAQTERGRQLQGSILSAPKFKDNFLVEYLRLFAAQ